jgi:hypothetical protein
MTPQPEEFLDDVVRLTTGHPAELRLLGQTITDAGIHCRLVGGDLDATLGGMIGAVAELWVHRNDLERAEEVMRQHQEEVARKHKGHPPAEGGPPS